ncbi:MAG: hypothetical protein E6R14_05235 [Thermomicrobiales bacterium]|nr:MAG: hypothetical protein E6R14_05235 [Thermomicrobiales bacterium]
MSEAAVKRGLTTQQGFGTNTLPAGKYRFGWPADVKERQDAEERVACDPVEVQAVAWVENLGTRANEWCREKPRLGRGAIGAGVRSNTILVGQSRWHDVVLFGKKNPFRA